MRTKRSHQPVRREAPSATKPATSATAMGRSIVVRRLPASVRARLDEAILLRPKELPTLEAIAAHFELSKYRISPAALRAYARRLESLARPAATGQLVSLVLGCLPRAYRRRVQDGTEVLLLSRIAQALMAEQPEALSVAELTRLAPVLAAMSRAHALGKRGAAKGGRNWLANSGRQYVDPTRLRSLVRGVYGLDLAEPKSTQPHAETQEPAKNSDQEILPL